MNMIIDAFKSLGANINKNSGKSNQENEVGIVSEKYPELTLSMSNEDLIKLTTKWEKAWNISEVKSEWEKQCEENEKYWLGKHYHQSKADSSRPDVDNAIFEALEIYLPQVTRRNPEAMVSLVTGKNEGEDDPEIQKLYDEFVKKLKNTLGDIADDLKFRLKLKKVARHWAIYVLGAAKMGWDTNKDMPTFKAVRAKKLILDPESTIDEDGYTGNRIGEYRKMEAAKLLSTLEAVGGESGGITEVKKLVDKNTGTEIQFIEWWTEEYICWTLGKEVLMKKKNPHWNYKTTTTPEPTVDEAGNEIPGEPVEEEGENHFPVPKMPYVFLSVFNLGKKPVDDTSLIGQNLSNQDRLNKRNRQIDRNVDDMNGGMIVSLERSGLTQQQAKGVTQALRNGGVVAIPAGAPRDAVDRMSGTSLPADVYNDRQDTRNRLADIFGTRGSSAAGLTTEKTVRGKYQNRALDTDRIGGGVSEYLEQFADDVYNWIVQLLYVYDETYVTAKGKPKVRITIKEGSLLPKDSQTIANQAIELAGSGKMSLIDLYKALERPNPEELAANAWLEVNAPEVLYSSDPRIQQVIQMRQQAAQGANEKPPSISISYKDTTPDIKAQILAKVGIQANPEAMAAHEDYKDTKNAEKRSIPLPPKAVPEVA